MKRTFRLSRVISNNYMESAEKQYTANQQGARRSGVDRHVCNVKATGSNPVESMRF